MIKILVVEDDEKLNFAVCKHLSYHNYYVKGVSDGVAAMNLLYTDKYDMIISDIMMPNMDGFEFCKGNQTVGPEHSYTFCYGKVGLCFQGKGIQDGNR